MKKVSQFTLKELTVIVEIAQSDAIRRHSATPGTGIKKTWFQELTHNKSET